MATQYLTPFVVPGYEPPAPDPETGEVRTRNWDERREIIWQMKQMRLVQEGMESPVAKAAISGAMGESPSLPLERSFPPSTRTDAPRTRAGFALGAFFSLMGSSFTIEDPFQRAQYEGMHMKQKARVIFADMGKGMWRQGKGFGAVGALYAGTECVVEGVRRSLSLRHRGWEEAGESGSASTRSSRSSASRALPLALAHPLTPLPLPLSRSSAPRTTCTTRSTPASSRAPSSRARAGRAPWCSAAWALPPSRPRSTRTCAARRSTRMRRWVSRRRGVP